MACVDVQGRNVLKKPPLLDTRNVPCDAPSKAASKSASSRNGGENQDPHAQGGCLGATVPNKGSRVSRLPMPIKSQRLKTLTDATQVQRKQQEPTKSKVQKRSCTKPVPFSLSQPRTARTAALGPRAAPAGQHPVAGPSAGSWTAKALSAARSASTTVSSSGSAELGPLGIAGSRNPQGGTSAPDSTVSRALPLPSQCTPSSRTCPPPPSTLHPSTQVGPPYQGTADCSNPAVNPQLFPLVEQSVPPSGCLKPPNSQTDPPEAGGVADGPGGFPTRGQDPATSSQTSAGPTVSSRPNATALGMRPGPSLGTTPRIIADPPRQGSIDLPQRVSARARRGGGANLGNPIPFSPDPVALVSILRNKGVHAGETPRGSLCLTGQDGSNDLPQRVPVTKPRHAAGGVTGNPIPFSPDPVALVSILRNKGVHAGETPRGSLCLTGQDGSNDLPQRVPVTKPRHAAGGVTGPLQAESMSVRTPTVGWTPQRVPNTRPQSMRKLLLTHRTPILRDTPKLNSVQGFSSALESCKEENVVQRLFEDVEEDVVHSGGKTAESQRDGFSEPAAAFPAAEVEAGPVEGGEQRTKLPEGQPFIQAPHRGSVIVFAQGGKVLDTPGTAEGPQVQKADTSPAPWDPHAHGQGPARLCDAAPPGLPPCPTSFSGNKAGGAIQRPARLGLVALALRHRLQPLEEVLLDDECAMYTSRLSASSTPLRRCGNPVASTLHFKDSMCFAPVSLPPLSFGQLPSAQSATSVSSCGFATDQSLDSRTPTVTTTSDSSLNPDLGIS